MHPSSYESMARFIREHLGKKKPGKLLEVGSQDINGSYRPLFEGWDYTGLDIAPGKAVDLVVADAYDWQEIEAGSCDVVISGQTLEHVAHDDLTAAQIARALKPGGLCCLIAPSAGPKHGYPDDYRRYTVESMTALAEGAGLEVLEAYRNDIRIWFDIVVIARKPKSKTEKVRVKP